MFLEGLAGHVTAHFLDSLSRSRLWQLRFLPCLTVARGEEVRVSFSALLCVADGDSYLLVKSLQHQQFFGPFGGVYKFHESGAHHLRRLDLRPHPSLYPDDIRHDLRGYLPRRNIVRLVKWFEHGDDREDSSTCLRRELHEELVECGLVDHPAVPQHLSFRFLRRVQEGPARALSRQNRSQYRVFDIYEPISADPGISQFLRAVRSAATTCDHLALATAREIIYGRTQQGLLIGHHAGYLFGSRRVRPDEPPAVEPSAAQ
jgi:SMODS-associated NUDIX domain